jgi:hypothetical protein
MEPLFKRLFFLVLPLFIIISQGVSSQPLRIRRATDICNPDSVLIGRISPDFKGMDLSGIELPVSALRGKYLCIMVWASSTHSSMQEYPYFLKIKKQFSKSSIRFLDIGIDKDKKDWEFYFSQNPSPGIHWYANPLKPPLSFFLLKRKDRGEHTYFSYTAPQFILLNPEGKIIENKIPFPPSDSVRFTKLLKSLP